ncbi:MAG: dTDP-glucose 4,6-dehydratase [Firmicutes bacterium]|nr:dTDP-glucose 4,6-dehydratase [Bacillota bacterium]
MPKILITGGAGFIGSNFIRYFLKTHNDVELVCLDSLTYAGNLANLDDIMTDSRFSFVRGDICDPQAVAEAMKDCEGVIHFAAETHVDRSILDADAFLKTNVLGTYNLLLEADRKKIKRFLHISTDEVYGSIEEGYFTENSPIDPSSPYSSSKASSDLLAISFFRTYGLPVVITRTCNNYGPYQYPEKVIPFFITNLLEGKKVPLYGDGKNVREWIYAEDNCRAIDLVYHKGTEGEVYNIGSGHELENIKLTEIILKALGADESHIEYVKDRPGHDRRYAIDSSKIKNLGWSPRFSFDEAISNTIEWYKNNRPWWENIRLKKAEYRKFMDEYYSKLRKSE